MWSVKISSLDFLRYWTQNFEDYEDALDFYTILKEAGVKYVELEEDE